MIFRILNKINRIILKRKLKSYGNGFHTYGPVRVVCPKKLEIGDNVTFNDYSYINASGGIVIGSNVSISAGVKILSTTLDYNKFDGTHTFNNVNIGNRVHIGANAVILPGVTIGNDIVIGAGAVVSKSLSDGKIYIGVPAIPLKEL
ncbi:acyltransferase [Cobetia amphilecti]|uniref:acyltransferase n=1 Tax=Cobetia amphilecti TaxID=1055104 RepID=UPI002941FA8C|nr:acyltransferase [Cobetia amphilecti]WOI24922.1 acyltransferase [Cobetia amphilecti]|tara:strand:- start:9024 stop:9461 length:438 start_codon:yes stop_codon:yes gene_type:complete